jgi:hypothetical protein
LSALVHGPNPPWATPLRAGKIRGVLDISRPELSVEALQESLVAAAQLPLIDEAVFPEQPDPDLIERRPGPGKQAGRPCEQIADFTACAAAPAGYSDREPGLPG